MGLLVSAKHLIGPNGGVEPKIAVAGLNRKIRSWHMFPHGLLPEQFVEAEGVGAVGLDDQNLDWLILRIKSTAEPLPATPLQLHPNRRRSARMFI